MGSSLGTGGGQRGSGLRRAAQLAAWAWLAPRLTWLTRGSSVIVVPNDAVFPYREIASLRRRIGASIVLMQEGIRFPLPGVSKDDAYGRSGAAICAWGEASAEYFRSQGAPDDTIQVTGNPRFDGFDPSDWHDDGQALLAKLGLARAPLLYLSNPIDDQGFCSTTEKMKLFRKFADQVAGLLMAEDRHLLVKLHLREDVAAFRSAARASLAADRTHVLEGESLFAALSCSAAAVVLASTVGLEALLFGLPLGVLEVPGAGFVFDYVQSGAAIGLRLGDHLDQGVADLLGSTTETVNGVRTRYLERHLANRGQAARRIAGLIEGLRSRS